LTQAEAGLGSNDDNNTATATNSVNDADTVAFASVGSDNNDGVEVTATDGGTDIRP